LNSSLKNSVPERHMPLTEGALPNIFHCPHCGFTFFTAPETQLMLVQWSGKIRCVKCDLRGGLVLPPDPLRKLAHEISC
jgi:transcription elongation factor Elf1